MPSDKEIEAALNAYYTDHLDNTTELLIRNTLEAAEKVRNEEDK